jgi:hypothetical protein
MNKRHAVVLERGKARVLVWIHDENLNRETPVRCNFSDFVNFYASRNVYLPGRNNNERRENLATWWLHDPGRRQYRGVTFAPNMETPGLFNLWRGFSVKEIRGDWSLMKAHIAEPSARTTMPYSAG